MGTMAGIVVGIVTGALLLVGGILGAWKRFASSQPYFSREKRRYEADGNQIYEVHEAAEADWTQIRGMYESAGRRIYGLHESVGRASQLQ